MNDTISGIDEWFLSSGYMASASIKNHPNGLSFAALPSTLRLLLATDGTVTKSLEALFWEPVSVDLDRQVWVTNPPPWSENQAEATTLLDRQVFLVGRQSNNVYSFAKSYINTGCLDDRLQKALLNERMGIGELLRSFYYEQYRKITDLGWYSPQKSVSGFNQGSLNPVLTQPCVYRTYTVTSQRLTLMQITEYFPVDLFSSFSQPQTCSIQSF